MKVRLEDQTELKFCTWPIIIPTCWVRRIIWTIWRVRTRTPPKPKCINQLLRAATSTQLLALTVPIQTTFQESQMCLEAVIHRVPSLQAQLKQTKMCTLISRQISQTSQVFLSFHRYSLCNNSSLTPIRRTLIDSKEIKLTITISRLLQIISSILRRVAILKTEMEKMNLWFRESNRIRP